MEGFVDGGASLAAVPEPARSRRSSENALEDRNEFNRVSEIKGR